MVEPAATYRKTIITPDEAAVIAGEVRRLIHEGDERSAWEQLRRLHPADMGNIVAALPRNSREAIVSVMSPDAVAWMFRHMNPVQVARVSARLSTGILSTALAQLNPRTALDIMRRIPGPHAREVAEAIGQPADDPVVETDLLDTAAGFMVTRFPTLHPHDRVETARANLRQLTRDDHNFTHVFVIDGDDQLVGQVAMIDPDNVVRRCAD